MNTGKLRERMKELNRRLVIIDLAGRVPYNVMVSSIAEDQTISEPMLLDSISYNSESDSCQVNLSKKLPDGSLQIISTIPELCKPYLKPMDDEAYEVLDALMFEDALDYFHEKHYDYRDLVKRNLAFSINKNNPYENINRNPI